MGMFNPTPHYTLVQGHASFPMCVFKNQVSEQ